MTDLVIHAALQQSACCKCERMLLLRGIENQDPFCLRFVAAVGASCSGDKPDKEESAGGFRCYGDSGSRLGGSIL